ncbi:MAG: hypothetical protein NTW86_07300, partial [Candidatus Sumerlaeota bacterium]|nr:hypothetical protein [Candidatus Sumerlaeota bacterium]
MPRFSFWLASVLLLMAGGAQAFEVQAKVKKLDPEQRTIVFFAAEQDRTAKIAPEAKFLDLDGKELADGLKSDQLKEGADVVLTVQQVEGKPVVQGIRLGTKGTGPMLGQGATAGQGKNPMMGKNPMAKGASMPTSSPAPMPPVDTSSYVALTDFGPNDLYHGANGEYKEGAKGGLYPNVSNARPAEQTKAGVELAKTIQPLDADGKPGPDGKIVLLGMGFSNSNQVMTGFIQAASQDKGLNPHLVIVNGCEGGRSAFMIQNPGQNPIADEYWKQWIPNKMKAAGVTNPQVEAIWLKETDAPLGPATLKQLGVEDVDKYELPLRMEFPKGAQTLEGELETIVRHMPEFFPNVKLVYVSSRSYGGWAAREGNREPWSYETGFAVKWLVEKQLQGDPSLNFDPAKGKVVAPWLSWGPYLWANGEKARKDGYKLLLSDYRDTDHMHYSEQGIAKVGGAMMN